MLVHAMQKNYFLGKLFISIIEYPLLSRQGWEMTKLLRRNSKID